MRNILIIDDEEAAVFGYTRYLSRQGFCVQAAGSIEEGRRQINCGSYDAIVLDLRLPDGNALEFITEILAQNTAMTVVVASGLSDPCIAQNALDNGAHQFLVKPLSMKTLCLKLMESFEKPRQVN